MKRGPRPKAKAARRSERGANHTPDSAARRDPAGLERGDAARAPAGTEEALRRAASEGPSPEAVSSTDLAAAARVLGLDLRDDQLERFVRYGALLQQWGAVFNLTAIRDAQGVLQRHLVDCLAIVPALRRELAARGLADRPVHILDVGSGAGLPAMVLAIVEPKWEVHAVDAVAKKVAFIRQVAAELALPNLHAHHGRVEALRGLPVFDLVTARAFSSLQELVRLSAGRLKLAGFWLAMKGVPPVDEIQALSTLADVFHVEPLHPPGVEGQRCIVWMRHRTAPAA